MFTLFNTSTPKLFAEIDRVRAQMFHVPAERVFQTLEVYMGSTFINDFNFLNRTFRVTAQAMGEFRQKPPDIAQFQDAQRLRRDGADRRGGEDQGHLRPVPGCAIQLFPAAEMQGERRAGNFDRHGVDDHGEPRQPEPDRGIRL